MGKEGALSVETWAGKRLGRRAGLGWPAFTRLIMAGEGVLQYPSPQKLVRKFRNTIIRIKVTFRIVWSNPLFYGRESLKKSWVEVIQVHHLKGECGSSVPLPVGWKRLGQRPPQSCSRTLPSGRHCLGWGRDSVLTPRRAWAVGICKWYMDRRSRPDIGFVGYPPSIVEKKKWAVKDNGGWKHSTKMTSSRRIVCEYRESTCMP